MDDKSDDLSDFVTTYVTTNVQEAFKKQMLFVSKPSLNLAVVSGSSNDQKNNDSQTVTSPLRAKETEDLGVQQDSDQRSEGMKDSDMDSNSADEACGLVSDALLNNQQSDKNIPSKVVEADNVRPTLNNNEQPTGIDDSINNSADEACGLVPDEVLDNQEISRYAPLEVAEAHNERSALKSPARPIEIVDCDFCDTDSAGEACGLVPDALLGNHENDRTVPLLALEDINERSNLQNIAPPIEIEIDDSDIDSADEVCGLVPDELLDNQRSHSPEIQVVEIAAPPVGRYFTRSKNRLRRAPLKRKLTRGTSKSTKNKKKRKNPTKEIITLQDTPPPPPKILPLDKNEDDFDDFNSLTNVKVFWQSNKIVKVPVRKLQKLDVVFNHLASTESVAMDRIVLTLNGISVKPTDTPHSLDLKITDFLDGGVINVESFRPSTIDSAGARKFDLKIKFQCADKKCVTLGTLRGDKMKILMIAFAEQIERPLNTLKFLFDGVSVSPDDTPQKLDIENNEVIDVVFES